MAKLGLSLVVAAAVLALGGCPSSGTGPDRVSSDTPEPPAPETPPAQRDVTGVPDGSSNADAEATEPTARPIARPAEPADFGPNPLRDGNPAGPPRRESPGHPPGHPPAGAGPVADRRDGRRLSRPPFDPFKENGRFFVGWPRPTLAVLISGRQDGYLEPCGCAGKERMKGGLMRRWSLFDHLRRANGWPVMGLDVGGLVKGFGLQAEMKFFTTVDAMRSMKYDAIALGASDLKLPADKLFSVVADTEALPSLFVSANVGVFGFAHGMSAKQRVIERNGVRVGVTSVLGKGFQSQINNPDVELADPVEALAAIVPGLKEQSDVMVLLAHATMEESEALAKKFPDFDVVVTAGGPPEPPAEPAVVPGTETLLVEVGTKGMAAVVLGIYEDPRQAIRYQRVIIDSRYPDSPQIRALFSAYQDQLRERGLAGLGIRPAPHPAAETLGRFVGSQKCESCHEASYDVWKKSGHSDAWKTLVDLNPPRNFDPECISCHVIGWHPTYYFPYEGGFLSEAETPELVDVGCESCHGPGQTHVRAEMGNDEQLQEKLRKAVVLTVEEAEHRQCVTCHDLDNSPDFDFATYWPLVEHHEDLPDEPEEE